MANFCTKCGSRLDENGQCPNCTQAAVPQGTPTEDPNKTVLLNDEKNRPVAAPVPPTEEATEAYVAPPAAAAPQGGYGMPNGNVPTNPQYAAAPAAYAAPNAAPPQGGSGAPDSDATVALGSSRADLPENEPPEAYFGPNAMPPHGSFGFGTPDSDATVAIDPARVAPSGNEATVAYGGPNPAYPPTQGGPYTLHVHDGFENPPYQQPYAPNGYGPNGMQPPYPPNAAQPPYGPNGTAPMYGPNGAQPPYGMPYDPNDEHTVAVAPTDGRTVAVYGPGEDGIPYSQPGDDDGDGKKSRAPLIIVIVILAVLLLGGGTAIALDYFNVVKIPVVTDFVDYVFGAREEKTDGKKPTGKTDPTETKTPTDPTVPTDATTAKPIADEEATASGVLSKDSAGNVILTMDKEKTFAVPADKQSVYGETVTVKTLRIQAADADLYVGTHATVTGTLKYDSASAGDKTVTLADCTFRETNSDKKWNEDNGVIFPDPNNPTDPTDDGTTPDYVGKTVTINMPDGKKGDTMVVRSAPNYDSGTTTVASVRNGDKVKVLEEKNGWVKIEVNGKTGWCNAIVAGIETDLTKVNSTVTVSSVSTSSNARNSSSGRSYAGSNVSDGSTSTCWMSSGSASGSGEWIQLQFSGTQKISGVKFLNGNVWSGDSENKNPFGKTARVKSFTLTFSDGTKKTYTAKDTNESSFGANIFIFDTPIETEYVRLTVNSLSTKGNEAYPNVVSITEFQAF